jgi:hypothetical protein
MPAVSANLARSLQLLEIEKERERGICRERKRETPIKIGFYSSPREKIPMMRQE